MAPVFRLDVGGTRFAYSRRQFIPDSMAFGVPQSDVSELALTLGGLLGLEYRFADRFTANIGLAAQRHFGSSTPWAFQLPVSFAVVW